MSRTLEDAIKDRKMLSQLHIGDKVKFNSPGKLSHNKVGIVIDFRKYEGKYGNSLSKEYRDYTAVIMELDDGKRISTSPRNLILLYEDVVSIVRCKNCKHSQSLDRTKPPFKYYKENCILCTCEDVVGDEPMIYLPNHFCSYGEEK